LELQTALQQRHPVRRRPAHHAVDPGRVPARVLLGHLTDRQQLRGPGADEQLLQVLHPRTVARLGGAEDPVLEAPYDSFRRGPIDVGPRHRRSPVGLFGLHRPTSPIGDGVPFHRFR
jgi:hypothetical protein